MKSFFKYSARSCAISSPLFLAMFMLTISGCESATPVKQTIKPAAKDEMDSNPLVSTNLDVHARNHSFPGSNELAYIEYAYEYLEQEKEKYSLDNPRMQLSVRDVIVDESQKKHVKFQQVHKKIPVWGREIIVHIDENNSAYSVSGEVLGGLNALKTHPFLTKKEIERVLMQSDQWDGKEWRVKSIELYIFYKDSKNYLAYRLTLLKGLLREFVFADANNGEVIHRISGSPTIH